MMHSIIRKRNKMRYCWLLICALVCACATDHTELSQSPVDATAMYDLGMWYSAGDESMAIPPDHEKALYWLQKAAGEGSLSAMHALGWAYYSGRGVSKDMQFSASHFRNAADRGYAESQYMLGLLYAQGWGVEKDSSLSLQWVKRAAEQGHPASQKLLGNLFSGAGQSVE